MSISLEKSALLKLSAGQTIYLREWNRADLERWVQGGIADWVRRPGIGVVGVTAKKEVAA